MRAKRRTHTRTRTLFWEICSLHSPTLKTRFCFIHLEISAVSSICLKIHTTVHHRTIRSVLTAKWVWPTGKVTSTNHLTTSLWPSTVDHIISLCTGLYIVLTTDLIYTLDCVLELWNNLPSSKTAFQTFCSVFWFFSRVESDRRNRMICSCAPVFSFLVRPVAKTSQSQ